MFAAVSLSLSFFCYVVELLPNYYSTFFGIISTTLTSLLSSNSWWGSKMTWKPTVSWFSKAKDDWVANARWRSLSNLEQPLGQRGEQGEQGVEMNVLLVVKCVNMNISCTYTLIIVYYVNYNVISDGTFEQADLGVFFVETMKDFSCVAGFPWENYSSCMEPESLAWESELLWMLSQWKVDFWKVSFKIQSGTFCFKQQESHSIGVHTKSIGGQIVPSLGGHIDVCTPVLGK